MSRTCILNLSRAFGAMRRSLPSFEMLNPRNLRSSGRATALFAEGLAAYEEADYLSHRAISGYSPQVFGFGIAGWNEWFLGYPNASRQAALEAVAAARRIGYPQEVDQALASSAYALLQAVLSQRP
jgi:hypothetical protein